MLAFTKSQRSLLLFCLYTSTALGLVSQPHITPPPIIARQNEQGGFLGYTKYLDNWYAESCPAGSSVRTSSTFFACVAATATTFTWATTCVDNNLLAPSSVTFPCGRNICYSIFIHSNLEDGNPKSAYACNTKQTGISLYLTTTTSREVINTPSPTSSEEQQPTAKDTLSSTTSATTPRLTPAVSSPSTVPEIASLPAQTFSLPSQSSNINSGAQNVVSRAKNKAWIAGPAVGGLAVLALIAGLALWIRRLKRREKANAVVANEVKHENAVVHPQQLDSKSVPPQHGVVETQQLDSMSVHRLDGDGRAELDAGRVGH